MVMRIDKAALISWDMGVFSFHEKTKALPDVAGESSFTMVVPNDVASLIPALDMSDPVCILVKACEIGRAWRT